MGGVYKGLGLGLGKSHPLGSEGMLLNPQKYVGGGITKGRARAKVRLPLEVGSEGMISVSGHPSSAYSAPYSIVDTAIGQEREG